MFLRFFFIFITSYALYRTSNQYCRSSRSKILRNPPTNNATIKNITTAIAEPYPNLKTGTSTPKAMVNIYVPRVLSMVLFPLNMAQINSKYLMALMIHSEIEITSTSRNRGSVILKKHTKSVAPSIDAAS